MTTNPSQVRALSLWRPWPWLILHAGKDVENRTWSTRYRGLLVLHAGKTIDQHALVLHLPDLGDLDQADVLDCGYVGVAELVDVHAADDCRSRHGTALCSPWAARDGWHWQLTNPRAFTTPIPGRGRQRLFTPPQKVIQAAATSLHQPGHD